MRLYYQIQYTNKAGETVHSDGCGCGTDKDWLEFLRLSFLEYLDNQPNDPNDEINSFIVKPCTEHN
jgi:hypothetical protein